MNFLSRDSSTSKATLMFLFVLISSVVLVFVNKLTGAEWCGLLQWCLPAFIGGEAVRKFAKTAPTPGTTESTTESTTKTETVLSAVVE